MSSSNPTGVGMDLTTRVRAEMAGHHYSRVRRECSCGRRVPQDQFLDHVAEMVASIIDPGVSVTVDGSGPIVGVIEQLPVGPHGELHHVEFTHLPDCPACAALAGPKLRLL